MKITPSIAKLLDEAGIPHPKRSRPKGAVGPPASPGGVVLATAKAHAWPKLHHEMEVAS